MSDFFTELRRRKIWWVAGVYLAVSWVIAQVVVQMEGSFALPAWLDMVVIIILAVGFPLALILAWAQETQASAPAGSNAIAPDTPTAGNDAFWRSIAVLPYDDFTNDTSLTHLAEGISDDIITHLAFDEFFDVTARNSSFRFRGKDLDLKEIGRELQVAWLLEGSIRVLGDTLRITSQLIDASTGNHVWADRSDQPLADIGRTQDAVTQQIFEQVNLTMRRQVFKRYENIAEEDLSAFGLYLRSLGDPTANVSHDKSMELLRRAIDKAEGSLQSIMRADLARVIAGDVLTKLSTDPEADRAEVLKLGQTLLSSEGQSAEVTHRIAQAYMTIGRFDEGLQLAKRALALHPGGLAMKVTLARTWLASGNAGEALSILQDLSKGAIGGAGGFHVLVAQAYTCLGDFDQAREQSSLAVLHSGAEYVTWLFHANLLALNGEMAEADDAFAEMQKRAPWLTLANCISGMAESFGPDEYKYNMTQGLELLMEREATSRA